MSWELLFARGGLDSASKELVRMFDYLANTRSLEKWEDWKIQSNPSTSSKKFEDLAGIVEICTNWIDKWADRETTTALPPGAGAHRYTPTSTPHKNLPAAAHHSLLLISIIA
ncbi:uncharacterized protein N7479_009485 [Penicillium vulpinum]|uniref:uncharacterized protein n=1 Tax=Penicillium vulpinum TaxID=29845 RepID=UPI002548DD27|nr:uncharacterized protein N7479_009485 [Penicillium vulpinum]KAJ5951072.1 hypothetical protein N7479_009485 [Penicillium vulpinum]